MLLPLLQGLDAAGAGAQHLGQLVDGVLVALGVGDSKVLLFALIAAFFLLKGAMLFCALATNSRIVAQLQQGLRAALFDRYSHMSYSYYITKSTGDRKSTRLNYSN